MSSFARKITHQPAAIDAGPIALTKLVVDGVARSQRQRYVLSTYYKQVNI